MKINKKIMMMGLGGLMAAAILMGLSRNGRGGEVGEEIRTGIEILNKKNNEAEIEKQEKDQGRDEVKTVNWGGEPKVVMDKMPVYSRVIKKWSKEEREEVMNYVGFKPTKERGVDENYWIYSNSEEKSSMVFDGERGEVNFEINLLLREAPRVIAVKSEAKIEQEVIDLVEKIIGNENDEVSLKVMNVDRGKDLIVLAMAYEIGGVITMADNTSWPIIVKTTKGGDVVGLTIKTVGKEIRKIGEYEIKNMGEILAINKSEMRILAIEGGFDADRLYTQGQIEEVNITNNYFGYLLVDGSEQIQPYVFFEGNSRLTVGPVKILMTAPALKQ